MRQPTRLQQASQLLLLPSLVVLVIYGLYTYAVMVRVPYFPITLAARSDGWVVTNSSTDEIDVDSLIERIGVYTIDNYSDDRTLQPLAGYEVGESVTVVIVEPDGSSRPVELTALSPGLGDRFRRFVDTILFFPLWLTGTLVLLLVQPRDLKWLLLVAFMYTFAIWLVVGGVSGTRVLGARIAMGAVGWLMLPLGIHLHLTVPKRIDNRLIRVCLAILYAGACVLAGFEIIQITPQSTSTLGAVLAIVGSGVLLFWRFARSQRGTPERIATRLMLAGILFALSPGIVFTLLAQLLSGLLTDVEAGALNIALAFIAVPIFPFFYAYAIFKRQLGQSEFRANRILSIYSFVLIYPPLFLLTFLTGLRLIRSGGVRTIFFLVVSVVFVMATPFLLERYQSWVNRLAYGTVHNPDEIIRLFATRLPSMMRRDALAALLSTEIVPSLLIRESALYLFEATRAVPLYVQGDRPEKLWEDRYTLVDFLPPRGVYREANPTAVPFSWVRLAIPLKVRDTTLGIWLLGRRDPDDFYPQQDIELLQALANQIAPVIENVRLYEALQEQADNLADEVASRTVELREERDRTQAILDSAGEGIFFIDPQGSIQYTNPAMTVMTGYEFAEMENKTLALWHQHDGDQDAIEALFEALNEGASWSGELMQRRRSGELYDVNLTIAPIRSGDGFINGFVGVQSDISKLKEVDRLKSNIISNVSHELKTPLTNMRMYLTLLERGNAENRSRYLDVLSTETERLTRLIMDLLDLSKLETGAVATQLRPTPVKRLLEQAIDAGVRYANGKEIQFTSDVQPGLPDVMADDRQFDQVLTNLVVNAVNYMQRSGTITLCAGDVTSVDDEQDGEPSVWIKVKDTGAGIAAEDIPQLFERFFRGQTALESGAPGTGLGLTICREIVERHNGHIEVESELGVGTTFTIWLHSAATERQKESLHS